MKKKTVLDERELQEMYRIEHAGLWLMYALLCLSVVVQLLMGASLVQMAGELFVIMVSSTLMIIANARHGIWDDSARPSVKGNAVCALCAGVFVAVIVAVMKRGVLPGLVAGLMVVVLCFLVLTALMVYVRRRQAIEEKAFDED